MGLPGAVPGADGRVAAVGDGDLGGEGAGAGELKGQAGGIGQLLLRILQQPCHRVRQQRDKAGVIEV